MRTTIMALAFSVATAFASPIMLTMDEVPTQPINGLTITKDWLSFTFSTSTDGLYYNSSGPGSLTYVQDPCIQGWTVPFSVAFSIPVMNIKFGLVESTTVPLATSVLLNFTAGGSQTLPLNLSLADPYAEGQFTWSGDQVSSMTVIPNASAVALGFDNLTVDTPEPATLSLVGIALVGLGALGAKRRRTNLGK